MASACGPRAAAPRTQCPGAAPQCCVVWAKQGCCRYWPCIRLSLDAVPDVVLRRRLHEQARKVQAKHPERRADGDAPTEVLVEFFGSHDYGWVHSSKLVPFRAGGDAPVLPMPRCPRPGCRSLVVATGRARQIHRRVHGGSQPANRVRQCLEIGSVQIAAVLPGLVDSRGVAPTHGCGRIA
jgi:hypothetical protein